jgi:CheY-like chemotaxis protein
MNTENLTKLITALGSLFWPLIVIYLIWTYRTQVADLISSGKTRKLTIKIGGQEVTMEEANQQQLSLIADLQNKVLELRKQSGASQPSPAGNLAQPGVTNPQSNNILWVDDNPKNNTYFIELLQKRGYRVKLAVSTRDALSALDASTYRLVLSDMARTEGGRFTPDAGVLLLEQMKKRNLSVPYVLFSSKHGVQEFNKRIKTPDAKAVTSSPTELRAILDQLAPEQTV